MFRTAHISFTGDPVPKRSPQSSARRLRLAHRPPEISEPLLPFVDWVFRRANIDASVYRSASLNRRLNACLRALRAPTAEAAQQLIEKRSELVNVALDTLLLGVSEFFRDGPVFQNLRDAVLPELLQHNQSIRILSAGCSEGHELYSLAMLLADAGALDRSELLGIDCRPHAIARAAAGWFSERDLVGLSPDLRARYFEADAHGAKMNIVLRNKVQWNVANVLQLDGFAPCDIILFRNVALYLTNQKADCAWSLLYGQLKPNGMLVCGKADKPPAFLALTRVAACIFKKHG